jgi:hypothetical protein
MGSTMHTGGRAGSRRRLRVELVLATLAGALAVLTVAWRDWIEAFGIEPDGGDGSLEWALVLGLSLAALLLGVLARAEWRRLAAEGRS